VKLTALPSPPGFDIPTITVQENGTYGGQGKAVGCVPPAALLFEQPSVGLCILTSIKDADCDPVVGIMSRVFRDEDAAYLHKTT